MYQIQVNTHKKMMQLPCQDQIAGNITIPTRPHPPVIMAYHRGRIWKNGMTTGQESSY